jgi:hypothetical protein
MWPTDREYLILIWTPDPIFGIYRGKCKYNSLICILFLWLFVVRSSNSVMEFPCVRIMCCFVSWPVLYSYEAKVNQKFLLEKKNKSLAAALNSTFRHTDGVLNIYQERSIPSICWFLIPPWTANERHHRVFHICFESLEGCGNAKLKELCSLGKPRNFILSALYI